MSITEPRTDVEAVESEPGFDSDDLGEGAIDIKIGDAHRIVERRIGDQFDDDLLERVETLVTCHLLTPALTGATQGKVVDQIDQESASVSFAVNEGLPGGIDSPFWQQASDLTDGHINYVDSAGVVGVR